MTVSAALPYDAIEHIRLDGTELIRLVSDADPTLSVPHCPGWSLRELTFHVARGWNFWAGVLSAGITSRNNVREIPKIERSPDHARLVDALFDAHVRLCDALHATDASMQVWTWTGSTQRVPWVARRMTHETMVHLWDAGQAIGLDFEFAAEVAADGIDEWLTWFAAGERAEGEKKVGGTIKLSCTDAELLPGHGEWFVSAMKEPKATFIRANRKGDAAIRGTAQDILMWLWRRSSNIEITGDEVVARRFQAFTDLT